MICFVRVCAAQPHKLSIHLIKREDHLGRDIDIVVLSTVHDNCRRFDLAQQKCKQFRLSGNQKKLYQLTMLASSVRARIFSIPLPFALFVVIVSAVYLQGVDGVPFHPDESTQLFNSGDAELFWQSPEEIFWQADKGDDLRQLYRELDAPLTRYLIAVGRWITGQPAPASDWDWGKTWQENERSGALPGAALLHSGRLAVAGLFPFSLLFLFLAARLWANEFTAWTAVILLASNALVLLHTRRAMAESALLFTSILTIWALLYMTRRPWLTAVCASLAFCAKQSLAPLAPAGMLAIFLQGAQKPERPLQWIIGQLASYSAAFLLIVLLLHPFAWRQPLAAFQAAVQARQRLASAQVLDRPEQALDTPARKLVGLTGSLYLTPPMFAETGNYQNETDTAETAYLANPLHSLFRSIPAGGIFLALGLFGFVTGIRAAIFEDDRQKTILVLAATVLQAGALLAFIQLPWQRYYMPLVPFAVLWTAYGLNQIYLASKQNANLIKRCIKQRA